jgi:hypothetical protein
MREYLGSSFNDICEEYIKRHPDLSNAELGRLIIKEHPGLKTSADNLRLVIGAIKRRRIQDVADSHGVEVANIKHLWIKDKESSLFVKNPDFQVKDFIEQVSESFEDILSKYTTETIKPVKTSKIAVKKAIKVTTSDDHLGLEPNPDGNALYQYEYGADVYKGSMDKVFNSVIKEYDTHGKFDLLLLDNLGDEQDGWNGLTTRGGHHLPQNMTNAEVFDCVVDTKVKILCNLVEANVANKIILRKVVNDNHSGDFGLIINKAVEKIINRIYSSDVVKIENIERFIEHRTYGKHCFLLTHGKDAKQMFKGLPLNLDPKTINYVNDYINFYNIKSEFIHLEKGDLHQIGYQKCSTFDYRNFMSFAPPSSWVQHNFGNSYSGYSIQVIPKESNEISHTDYFLDYTKRTS